MTEEEAQTIADLTIEALEYFAFAIFIVACVAIWFMVPA